jgi:hypothetical protein
MSQRGVYGKASVGADVYHVHHGSSLGTWLLGGLAIGGAVLWAKHQADQIDKLSAAAGLPHPSFAHDLRQRSKELASSASAKIHDLTRRYASKKEG